MEDDLLIFLSYAPEDTGVKDDFIKEFRPAAENNSWAVWQKGEILPGANWDNEVKANLNKARVVVLFVSSDFLASEYIDNVELKQALERQNDGSTLVIPLILDNCLWEDHKLLPKIQAIRVCDKISDYNDKQQLKAALQFAARAVRDSVKAFQPTPAGGISDPANIAALHALDPEAFILAMRAKREVYVLLPQAAKASVHRVSEGFSQKVLSVLQRLLVKGDLEDSECRVLGEALFNRLFPDPPAQKSFIAAYQSFAAAAKPDKPLKIVLHFDDASNDMASLPWEYLWLPLPEGTEEGFFVGEKENVVLTRRLSTGDGGKEKKVEADQLRILIAYSKPGVREIADRIEEDANNVFSRTHPGDEESRKLWLHIKVKGPQEFRSQKTFEDFIRQENPFHIVHFVGEGKTETGGKNRIAFFDSAAKKEDWLAPDELVKCFPADKRPNLIFLHPPPHACRSLRDMALNLVTSVDGVLAIQTPVKSEEAADFSEKLYTALAQGKDLDEAVTRAARYVASKSANRLKMYGLSVFFSRATLKMEVAKPLVSAPTPDLLLGYLACPNWDKSGIECGEKIRLQSGGRPTRLFCENEKCKAGPIWQCPQCNNLIILTKTICPRCGYETARINLPDDIRRLLSDRQEAKSATPGNATDRTTHPVQESRRSEPGLPR